jgi:predicted DNA-binding transcriptional regulator YafY
MRRADRLFSLILLLGGSKRVTTAAQIARSLEVSERTVYRDIADLMASGVPVDGQAGVGYRLRPGYQLPPLMFTETEIEALALGAEMVQAHGDAALAAAAGQALAKVRQVVLPSLQRRIDSNALLAPDFVMRQCERETLGELRAAINATRKVWLRYLDAEANASERVVWPLGLIYWGQTWTLGAWCELRRAYRTFRIDRVDTLSALAARFDAKNGGLLDEYVRSQRGE